MVFLPRKRNEAFAERMAAFGDDVDVADFVQTLIQQRAVLGSRSTFFRTTQAPQLSMRRRKYPKISVGNSTIAMTSFAARGDRCRPVRMTLVGGVRLC